MTQYTPYSPEWLADNRSRPLQNVSIAFIVVQTFFVVLFLIARYIKKTLLKADVWFILFGYAWNLVSITATLCMIHLGLGLHIFAVVQRSYHNLVIGLKFLLVQQFAYLLAVAFPKLAILYLYSQLLITPTYRKLIYATGAIVIAGVIALSVTTFLNCRPLAYNWDKLIPGGHCGDIGLLFKLVSVPNLITDFAILILPLPMVWRLQMRTSRKIGLAITFLTGSFGTLTAILRLYYFSTGNLFADLTYNGITTTCWTVIEPSCYLIAAIMPSLRPLLRTIRDSSIYASLTTSRNGGSYISRQDSHATGATSTELVRKPSAYSQATATTTTMDSEKSSIAVTREYFIEHVPGLESDHALEELGRRWGISKW